MPTLRYLRTRSGMTAVELAAEAGVSTATINRMERGKTEVSLRIAYRVLNVLSNKLGRSIEVDEVEGLRVKDE